MGGDQSGSEGWEETRVGVRDGSGSEGWEETRVGVRDGRRLEWE